MWWPLPNYFYILAFMQSTMRKYLWLAIYCLKTACIIYLYIIFPHTPLSQVVVKILSFFVFVIWLQQFFIRLHLCLYSPCLNQVLNSALYLILGRLTWFCNTAPLRLAFVTEHANLSKTQMHSFFRFTLLHEN